MDENNDIYLYTEIGLLSKRKKNIAKKFDYWYDFPSYDLKKVRSKYLLHFTYTNRLRYTDIDSTCERMHFSRWIYASFCSVSFHVFVHLRIRALSMLLVLLHLYIYFHHCNITATLSINVFMPKKRQRHQSAINSGSVTEIQSQQTKMTFFFSYEIVVHFYEYIWCSTVIWLIFFSPGFIRFHINWNKQ